MIPSPLPRLNPTRVRIRKLTCFLLGPFLCLLSLTSFLVLLSFSALAFNWCRVSPSACSESDLVAVYEVGVDLFLSSMLALIATFLAWVQLGQGGIPVSLNPVFFALHWFFLLGALVLFLIAVFSLLQVVKRGQGMTVRDSE
jgi:quinol-cytochrome oxidoreductase complex cytochrome b subunit